MAERDEGEAPLSGSIPLVAGLPAEVRIPIPGEHRLAVELRTRDPRWSSRSTSRLFIQDPTGKGRLLRLDYDFNPTTNTTDYHWNQKGVYDRFGIANHTPVGRLGALAYEAARAFRYVGRTLVVVGAAVDVVSIVRADQPLRRASAVVSAWALAVVGCKAGGYVGAGVGTVVGGTAGLGVGAAPGAFVGAFAGCIVGGAAGYWAGERVGDMVYQWAEGTVFTPLPEVRVP